MSRRRWTPEEIVVEKRRAHRFFTLMTLWTFALIVFGAFLSGCTSTDYRRPPGVYVGPYDITLSSHREALGLKP